MASEALVRGALPRVQWGPVIAGTLCAIAAHIVLGLFGVAFGLAAEPSDSGGIGVAAGVWGMLVPFVASLIGAWVCVRVARETDAGGAGLHGALVWCIGLVAGALFLTGSMASGMMSSATAMSGNAAFAERQLGDERAPGRSERRQDAAAAAAAAASGAAGLGAILGLCGAFAGAALGRSALTGAGRRRGRPGGIAARLFGDRGGPGGYREEMGPTGGHGGRFGAARPDAPRDLRPDDPTIHH